MSNPIGREWRFYLADMIEFAEKVLNAASISFGKNVNSVI